MTDRARPPAILVATDLGENSDGIVRAAGALAAQAGAELHVVHVVARAVITGAGTRERGKERREAFREELDRQVGRALADGPEPASRVVRVGQIHEEIELRAEEVGAELLVMGPHRGSIASGYFLGSTADRLLRTSRLPCLVVRRPFVLPLRRVAVPLDLSEPSRGALKVALEWAGHLTEARREADDPRLLVVHVGSPVTRADDPTYEVRTLWPELEEVVRTAREGSELTVGVEVVWAHEVGSALCGWILSREVDLLVAGTHGRSGLPRALLGSVASRLCRESPASVLLVPPPAG